MRPALFPFQLPALLAAVAGGIVEFAALQAWRLRDRRAGASGRGLAR